MVGRYCLGCHNDNLRIGDLSLAALRTAEVATGAHTWEKVLRKVRAGEMPPPGLPVPDPSTRASFVQWLETKLDVAAAAQPNPGTPSLHRLNRVEYRNAIRDLLALDLDHASGLPVDDAGYGFDNIGDVLTVSPLHLEKYMATARRVSRLAVGTVKLKPSIERFTARRPAHGASLDELPLSVSGGVIVRHYFPVNAEYSILVRVRGEPPPGMPGPKLDLRMDGRRVQLFDVKIDTAEEAQYTRNHEIRLPLQAGMHTVAAGLLGESQKPETTGAPPPDRPAPVSVDYVLIGGPFNQTGPGETESRKRVFVCRPATGEAEETCARTILESLARRAYRRPVDHQDVRPLMKLFAEGRQGGGSFDTGIEMALRGILVSPGFLFRIEQSPASSHAGAVHRISAVELASRLSFFLWSSIPDDELLKLAERGSLRDPEVLHGQVRRMLSDPRCSALVDNFGGQWLHLRNVAEWRADPEKYPDFDEPLREALQRETELFFAHIVREDRSILDFIDANYTFLNERLAQHYGIPDVRGSYYRYIPLTGPERGGVLTHGSVLTVTSYPTRTSPVLRGKWILENVLGAPPPPPPPDVPALTDNASNSARNLREALESHRANPACASCHARLDPLGFALENYDAVGKYRTREDGSDIDASGSLPGGTVVSGPRDLKKVLLDRRDEFVECFAGKLLTYALGRGLEFYDVPAIRRIRREAALSEFRFSSVVLAIVDSVPFQMRRVPDP
jgi:hypothetical protein